MVVSAIHSRSNIYQSVQQTFMKKSNMAYLKNNRIHYPSQKYALMILCVVIVP